MNLLSLRKTLIAALLLVLLCSASALAAAIVSITPNGENSYTLQGSDMDGVAGISLDLSYDSSSLSSPSAAKGGLVSGAMFAANTTFPGSIKIAIISTNAFSGSGQIATITFAGRTGTGGITSASVNMIDSKGAALVAAITVTGTSGNIPSSQTDQTSQAGQTSQTSQTSQAGQTSQTSQTSQTGQTGSSTTSLGTVTLPAADQQIPVTTAQPPPSPSVPEYIPEPATPRTAEKTRPSAEPVVEAKLEETPQYVVFKGILDRFKLYNGNKKLSAVVALFDKKIVQTIQQSPAIVISSGLDKALLTIDIPARIKSSPNFAANGGTIVSFQQDKRQKGRWMVDILPESGSLKVTVTIIAGAEEFEYPLTVVPPVKTALTLDEKGWDKFITETGTEKAPLHDFNNDGIRDYIDEYILAANIIAKKLATLSLQ